MAGRGDTSASPRPWSTALASFLLAPPMAAQPWMGHFSLSCSLADAPVPRYGPGCPLARGAVPGLAPPCCLVRRLRGRRPRHLRQQLASSLMRLGVVPPPLVGSLAGADGRSLMHSFYRPIATAGGFLLPYSKAKSFTSDKALLSEIYALYDTRGYLYWRSA